MHVLVTGSSGMIGQALVPALEQAGMQVTRAVRRQPATGETFWDPAAPLALDGIDAVVHLAGENIAGRRWTANKKAHIRESRVASTRVLADAIAAAPHRPTLICASAIGYYGDRGDEKLTEESSPGRGFLAEVCQAWEAATEPAGRAGARVVRLRIGFVLSPSGGGLKAMLRAFRLGLGGRVGSGRQWVSWVSVADVIGAILFALRTPALAGAVNLTAPHAVTNEEFTNILARVLRRPAVFPIPGFAVRLKFGEMGEELLLASTRVAPARLEQAGYRFRQAQLEPALRDLLGK